MSQVSDQAVSPIASESASRRVMLMIVYPDYLKEEIVQLMDTLGVPGFTETQKVLGRGPRGLHFDNPIWPGSDEVIYTAVGPEHAVALQSALADLSQGVEKRTQGLYGLHVFSWPCDQVF